MLRANGGAQFPPLVTKATGGRLTSEMAAASRASYADVASGRARELQARNLEPYLSMIIDPMNCEAGERYPDETIVPTALTHFTATRTVVTSNPTSGSSVSFLSDGADDFSATVEAGGSTSFATSLSWKADAQCILYPQDAGSGVRSTYNPQMATFRTLAAVDRTLAAGIRARVVGLPTNSFMPSGSLYFLQVQQNELGNKTGHVGLWGQLWSAQGEAVAMSAVTAGKGFCVTLNELSKANGVTVPFLPQGPMSFVFSDTQYDPSSTTGLTPAGTAGLASPSEVLSANGLLLVVGFGLTNGTVIRLDYAHHVEYIPQASASGMVVTDVAPPSTSIREGISRATMFAQKHLSGQSSLAGISSVTGNVDPASVAKGLAKAAVSLIPGGSAFAQGAAAVSRVAGAPPWLTSILSSL